MVGVVVNAIPGEVDVAVARHQGVDLCLEFRCSGVVRQTSALRNEAIMIHDDLVEVDCVRGDRLVGSHSHT